MALSVAGTIGAGLASVGASHALDLSNSIIGGLFSNYLGRKNEKKSLERQYQYAMNYALNSPSWTVEGLRKANLNPILAATDGAFASPTVPNSGYNSPSLSSGGSSPDFMSAIINANAVKNTGELQKSQEALNYTRAINEMKNMGFTGDSAVAARLFSSLVGQDVLKNKSAKEAFESLWNNINKPSPTTVSTPNGSTTPSHDVKSRHHPSDTPSRIIAEREERDFDKKFGLDKSTWWQSKREQERKEISERDAEFERNYKAFRNRFFKHK